MAIDKAANMAIDKAVNMAIDKKAIAIYNFAKDYKDFAFVVAKVAISFVVLDTIEAIVDCIVY